VAGLQPEKCSREQDIDGQDHLAVESTYSDAEHRQHTHDGVPDENKGQGPKRESIQLTAQGQGNDQADQYDPTQRGGKPVGNVWRFISTHRLMITEKDKENPTLAYKEFTILQRIFHALQI